MPDSWERHFAETTQKLREGRVYNSDGYQMRLDEDGNLLNPTKDKMITALIGDYRGQYPISLGEEVSRTQFQEKVPFAGSVFKGARFFKLHRAAKRWERGYYADTEQQIQDMNLLLDHLKEQTEAQQRGKTLTAQIFEGGSELPAFMVEFLATTGAAAVAKKTVVGGGTRLLTRISPAFARTAFVQRGLQVTGVMAAAGTRTLLMPNRVFSETGR